MNAQNANPAEFCNPAIDREIARAQALQTSDPEAASRLWAKVDRDITDQAPWVAFANGVVLEVVSDTGRQLPVQPPVGHAARPALGALTLSAARGLPGARREQELSAGAGVVHQRSA